MKQYLMMMAIRAKMAFNKFFSDEKGEVNIVAIVVLIGIAVLLALVFKDAIAKLLKDMFSSIQSNMGDSKETIAPLIS